MLELREVIAYDNNGELIVICGNMRLKALKELGIKEVPTKILPIETSVEKLKAYTIKDNVSFGDHDWDVLANEWDAEQLDAWGLDVPDFTAEEIEAEEDDFDTTPPEKPITVLGDLYEIGEHRLLCGDSTDSDEVAKLMNGQKADMVFTDPPYNLGEIIKGDTFITENKRLIENQSWDKGFKIEETVVIADVFTKKDASVYIFTSQYLFGDIVKKAKIFSQNIQFCVWIKKNPQPNMGKRYFTQSCELCVFYTKGKHIFNFTEEGHEYNFWEFNKEIHSTIHPTEKPVNIPSHAILKSSIQNSLVLDLFLGSGSTMVASHQLKRKCYGMELDCRYADVIVRRMLKLDPTLSLKRNGVDCKSEFQ
jgi:DNA modification methylase